MSGIQYLLDTNIVIGALNEQPAAVKLVQKLKIHFSKIAISQISRMELLSFPRLAKEEEKKVHAFLDDCLVILCDEKIEQAAIDLRREHGLKLPDAIIAATAKVNSLELVTLDKKLAKLLT